jgi:O-acetyl-ADP-ribose deacetylase (regulator of RNase III)
MIVLDKDITTVEDGYIFHQVDVTYAMGAGLAKQIVAKWPIIRLCIQQSRPSLGESVICGRMSVGGGQPVICSLVAQRTMGRTGKHTLYWAFAAALRHFQETMPYWEALPCYFPWRIGCGLGGGDWDVVRALIEEQFPDAFLCRRP